MHVWRALLPKHRALLRIISLRCKIRLRRRHILVHERAVLARFKGSFTDM